MKFAQDEEPVLLLFNQSQTRDSFHELLLLIYASKCLIRAEYDVLITSKIQEYCIK